jgi:biopolymer transport protein ExbD
LPSSKSNTIVIPKITVSITKDLQFAVNDRKVGEAMVEQALTEAIKATNSEENVVVLHIDKEVPVQYLVKVAGVATQLKAKVSIATKPE